MNTMWRKDRNTLSQLSSEEREQALLDTIWFWKVVAVGFMVLAGAMAITN